MFLFVALALTFVLVPSPVTPSAALTQTGVLSYHAAVPVSDTYPTGEVVTGDPVFTKLLDTLGVSFHYGTDAPRASVRGTARLDAALSTANGWHTTLPMVAPTPLIAGASDLTGTLDLARIHSLTSSVGKATGLDAGTVDVIVSASVRVSVNGDKPVMYKSQLPFQLTALELSLSGAKPSPSSQGPAITSTSALGPTPPTDQTGTALRQIRLGLFAALLLAVGAMVVLWPAGEDDRAVRVAPRVRAVGLQNPNTPRIQLADLTALEDLAECLGCPIVESDRWEAAVTSDALYWAPIPQQPPTEPTAPAQAA